MPEPLLTPEEVLAYFRRKDRHWPRRAAARGLIEAVNVGGSGNGARYLYRLKNLEAESPTVNEGEMNFHQLKKAHGL